MIKYFLAVLNVLGYCAFVFVLGTLFGCSFVKLIRIALLRPARIMPTVKK